MFPDLLNDQQITCLPVEHGNSPAQRKDLCLITCCLTEMNDRTKHILVAVSYVILGGMLTLTLALLLQGSDGLQTLRQINDHYAAVLGTAFSLVLIVITAVYVVLTYLQVHATQKSVRLNREFLVQAEKQLLHSRVPMLVAEMVKSRGGAYFAEKRRQLHVYWKLRNIGDGPAVQIHTRMKLRFSHAEFEDFDELFEHSFEGSAAPAEEKTANMHFETVKIEKMLEDFSIKVAKNQARLRLSPHQSAYRGPELALEIIYSNVHGQFFKTEVVCPIGHLRVKEREDEKERRVYWMAEKPLQDNEEFELALINPIFSTFKFSAVDTSEAQEFIDRYRKLL